MAKNKLPRVTPEQVLAWNPCEEYDIERLRKLWGKRKTLNAINMLKLNISYDDRFWAVLREGMIPERTLHIFACDVAEHVLPVFEKAYPKDERPRKAIETKRLWLAGKATDEELNAARAAARDAARAAARAADADAAWAADADAAWAAARDASGAAARAAAGAWDASGGVAGAAEQEWQLGRLLELLNA